MDVMENILNDKNVIVIRVSVSTVVTISQAPYEFRPHHCSILQMKKLGYSHFSFKEVYTRVPGTWAFVRLHGKGEFRFQME